MISDDRSSRPQKEMMNSLLKNRYGVMFLNIWFIFMMTACHGGGDGTESPQEPAFELNVEVAGTGKGLVRSADGLIYCAEDCSEIYGGENRVLLSAYEDEGSQFIGWSGDCAGKADCALVVDGVTKVRAEFQDVQLEDTLTSGLLESHLHRLSLIAAQHSGHRRVGSAGYDASAAYVKTVLDAANSVKTVLNEDRLMIYDQDVAVKYFEVLSDPLLEVVSPYAEPLIPDVDFRPLIFSGGGDVTGPLVFIDPVIPPGAQPNTSDDGCSAADFENIDAAGKIVAIQRGRCTFQMKAENAQTAGAAGLLIFNEGQADRSSVFTGDLTSASDVSIPVFAIGYDTAERLFRLAKEVEIILHMAVSVINEPGTAKNVFAETPGGDPEQIIMIGAELGSRAQGPGINDNGSGTAAVLELANQITRKGFSFRNKIRFAWWADNDLLAGSRKHAEMLTYEEAQQIALYLNADTVASVNYVIGVYDGDVSDTFGNVYSIADDPGELPSGTGEIEESFRSYFFSLGVYPESMPMLGDSAYYPLMFLDIPFGGLFTGTDGRKTYEQYAIFGGTPDAPYDPCHLNPCDDINNFNADALLINSRALAFVLVEYADRDMVFPSGIARSSGYEAGAGNVGYSQTFRKRVFDF